MNSPLENWLAKINKLHSKTIELGLERVSEVARRLELLNPDPTVIIVGGTNGKGSTVAGLEAIYLAQGYRVGTFTSPYLMWFNEIVRINANEASDEDFINAFEKIDKARGDTTLTPFEFNTLAALEIFKQKKLDVYILEVGLGGRLDAVNILDADLAITTSIDIDHADLLGDTREKIAIEKAGIYRSQRPAIYGDDHPPQTLIDYAHNIKTPIVFQGQQFGWQQHSTSWSWWSETQKLEQLPIPTLALQNMAIVLMAIELLEKKLPVMRQAIDSALNQVKLSGRIQVIPGDITTIYDVSHNPASAKWLANYLQITKCEGKTRAVFSMLKDKDMLSTILVVKDFIDEWYVAPLQSERAVSTEYLVEQFAKIKIKPQVFLTMQEAYQAVKNNLQTKDRLVIFGSFYTVSAILSLK